MSSNMIPCYQDIRIDRGTCSSSWSGCSWEDVLELSSFKQTLLESYDIADNRFSFADFFIIPFYS